MYLFLGRKICCTPTYYEMCILTHKHAIYVTSITCTYIRYKRKNNIKTSVLKTGSDQKYYEVHQNKISLFSCNFHFYVFLVIRLLTYSSIWNYIFIIMRFTLVAIWICVLAKPSLQSDLLKYLWNPIKYSIGMIVDPIRYVILWRHEMTL